MEKKDHKEPNGDDNPVPEEAKEAEQHIGSSARFWWAELKPFLTKIVWGNPYLRFMTLAFASGLAMLSPTLLEVVLARFQIVLWPAEETSGNKLSLQEIVALCLIVFGVLGHLLFHLTKLISKYRFWRIRVLKNKLTSTCEDIARAYTGTNATKPAGFMSEEIKNASSLAKSIDGRSDHDVFAHPVFSMLLCPRIDASGENPLFGLSAQELRDFAKELKNAKV